MKETKTIELKEVINNTYLKTVSAFANFGDGKIYFGITDYGEKKGIDDPRAASLNIENQINDLIKPRPNFHLSIDPGNIIILEVFEGPHKPYLYRNRAYRRSDTSTVEVDQMEMKRLVLLGSHLYYEALPSVEQNLTFRYLGEIFKENLSIEDITTDVQRTLGFFTSQSQYNHAAALFADHNNFPGIDIARFGKSINEIFDREVLQNCSILKQFFDVIELYKKHYQYEKIDGVIRQQHELIPEIAVREAVANALVHRTWDTRSHIRVEMHPDKIQVYSPGGLPKDLSREDYLKGTVSSLRNPIVGNVFFRLRIIEMFGTGIRRIKESYTHSMRKPEFDISDDNIMVTLPTVGDAITLPPEEKAIYELLVNDIALSSGDITAATGFKKDKVLRLIGRLKSQNYIKQTGAGRGTKYHL